MWFLQTPNSTPHYLNLLQEDRWHKIVLVLQCWLSTSHPFVWINCEHVFGDFAWVPNWQSWEHRQIVSIAWDDASYTSCDVMGWIHLSLLIQWQLSQPHCFLYISSTGLKLTGHIFLTYPVSNWQKALLILRNKYWPEKNSWVENLNTEKWKR